MGLTLNDEIPALQVLHQLERDVFEPASSAFLLPISSNSDFSSFSTSTVSFLLPGFYLNVGIPLNGVLLVAVITLLVRNDRVVSVIIHKYCRCTTSRWCSISRSTSSGTRSGPIQRSCICSNGTSLFSTVVLSFIVGNPLHTFQCRQLNLALK